MADVPANFFSLPAELRIQVYSLVFDHSVVVKFGKRGDENRNMACFDLIWANEGRTHISTCTSSTRKRRRFTAGSLPATRRAIDPRTLYQIQSGYAICFASRQAYAECLGYLYQHVKFAFRSQTLLHNFILGTTSSGLGNITTLHLDIETYGDSSILEYSKIKERQRSNWSTSWRIAAERLLSLRDLTAIVEVNAVPLRFSFSEDWVTPILHFAQCPLQSVEVHLTSRYRTRKQLLTSLANRKTLSRPGYLAPVYPSTNEQRRHCAIHQLFERALEKKLLSNTSMDDSDALQEFRAACRDQYRHFNYPYLMLVQFDH